MSIEYFLAVNLAADLALLAAVARGLGALRWRRALAADGLCAAYAVLAALRPMPWALPPVQLVLLVPVAMVLVGRREAKLWGPAWALLCAAALLCGGAARLMPGPAPLAALAGIACGTAVLALALAAKHPLRDGWQVNLRLSVGDTDLRFPALIDTGNRLREPLSGQPVLIAEARLLRGALPEGGYRVLRFGALGGDGRLACFRPRAVWIERGRRVVRGPDVWVAVAPGRLPGAACALAPCEFAVYID